MARFSRVLCARCDRDFSGALNRCPHCGFTRGRPGRQTVEISDPLARFFIKCLLLLALLISVITVITISIGEDHDGPNIIIADDDEDKCECGEFDEDSDECYYFEGDDEENEDVLPVIPITGVTIYWEFANSGIQDDVSIDPGSQLPMWAITFPAEAEGEVTWSSNAITVVNFTVDSADPTRIVLEGRSSGIAVLTARAGDHYSELIVRVR